MTNTCDNERTVWTDNAGSGSHRLAASDAELVGFFTASVGVRAQQYEGGGGAFDSNETHTSKLKAMRWLAPGTPPSAMTVRDRVASSLAELPRSVIEVLAAVYMPHGWPLLLADALCVHWGGGSLVALAVTLPRASRAAGGGNSAAVAEWLGGRAERIERIEIAANRRQAEEAMRALVKNLRDDAESIRLEALAAYDAVRLTRVDAEVREARERRERRQRASADLLAEELGMSRRIARAMFERRTRKVAA